MFGRTFASIMAIAACASASGPAMSAPSPTCRVIGGEKLPIESGGAAAICSAVERAIASQAPTLHVTVKVHVLSSSTLRAAVVANGRKLPDQHFAITDRVLNRGAIDRFAQAIAQAAKDGMKA